MASNPHRSQRRARASTDGLRSQADFLRALASLVGAVFGGLVGLAHVVGGTSVVFAVLAGCGLAIVAIAIRWIPNEQRASRGTHIDSVETSNHGGPDVPHL
jgi:Flp pilus assembly protein TadB